MILIIQSLHSISSSLLVLFSPYIKIFIFLFKFLSYQVIQPQHNFIRIFFLHFTINNLNLNIYYL
jgi:hypothetical protein